MPPIVNPRLTNLGITSGTATGEQGAEQPFVNERLKAMMQEQVGLTGQLQAARGADPRSMLERLGSPAGIATAGTGVLASLFGAPEVGLPLLQGLLQGTAQAVQTDQAQYLDRIDKLESMLEKQQQRVVTLLQSQPGLFVTPEGTNLVDPEFLGLTAGMPVPISPASKNALASRTVAQDAAIDVYAKLMTQAETSNQRYAMAKMLVGAAGLEVSEPALATFLESSEDRAIVDTLFEEFDPNSVMTALAEAQVRGLHMFHPEIIKLYSNKPKIDMDWSSKEKELTMFYWSQFNAWLGSDEGAAFLGEDPYVALEAWSAADLSPDGLLWLNSQGIKNPRGQMIENRDIMVKTMQANSSLLKLDQYRGGGAINQEKRDAITLDAVESSFALTEALLPSESGRLQMGHIRSIEAALESVGRSKSEVWNIWTEIAAKVGKGAPISEATATVLDEEVAAQIKKITDRGGN